MVEYKFRKCDRFIEIDERHIGFRRMNENITILVMGTKFRNFSQGICKLLLNMMFG